MMHWNNRTIWLCGNHLDTRLMCLPDTPNPHTERVIIYTVICQTLWAVMIHDLSLLNIAPVTPETMTNNCLSWEDEQCGLTLSQSVEGTNGWGIRGDADFLLCQGAFDVHCQSAVYVCVQVIHHSSGERHIH